MNNRVDARLRSLERKTPGALIGRFTNMETGEVKVMPFREVTRDFQHWRLDRVVSGNRLADLDNYLGVFKRAVNAT